MSEVEGDGAGGEAGEVRRPGLYLVSPVAEAGGAGGPGDESDAGPVVGDGADPGPAGASPGEPDGIGGRAPGAGGGFRVRCPDCGPQLVALADVRYVETGEGAAANRYSFVCPGCGARVRRPAGPEMAEVLRSSGVATLALRRGSGESGEAV